ncbi:MFS transporter [Alicyclobacillus contaminans]|uniref:MFS transporter n=1 Tax=Alicyclobacillus contaminans TaxID=392016 RepID=UPI001FDEE7F9|nr:MFS transporter [Alicyclobacillus contaminans]
MLGQVLSSLDQTVISLAMPTVSTRLGGLNLYGWVFVAYMLTSTVSIPIYGKLADLFGRKQVYLAGGLIFLVGSLLCGLAWNMAALVGFRAIQGLGAGCLMPVAFTLIADLYPIQERGRFQAPFGAVLTLASICGPAVGGVMVQYWNWRWIFYMSLVIGMPALLVVGLALHEQRQRGWAWGQCIPPLARRCRVLWSRIGAGWRRRPRNFSDPSAGRWV